MKRLLLALAAGGLLIGGSGCASDPTGTLVGSVAGVTASFSYVQVTVADSVAVIVEVKDQQGNTLPTLADVTSADPSIAAVSIADLPPLTQRRFYIRGVSFGETTIGVTAGGVTTEIDVQTYPDRIAITGISDTVRSGDLNTIVLTALDKSGNPVAGVPMTVVTGDADVLALDDATLETTAKEAGFSTLTASGPGGATGTRGVRVIAGAPVSAALAATTFGAVAAAGTSTLELLVFDAAGNENHLASDVTGVTVNSSNGGVATAVSAVVDTAEDGTKREIFVTATGVSAGTSNISGSVATSSGALAFAAAPVTVLDPQVTGAAPSGAPGTVITINGSGLSAAGFETQVLVDGSPVGNVTSVSATQIMAQMPTLAAGTYDLEVSVGGVVSNADSWTQVGAFSEATSEPNDVQGQEAPISASFAFSGTADEATDYSDLFEFTVSADDLVIDLVLAWGDGNDLDVLIYPKGAQDPGDYSEDACDFDLSTLANPETGTCTLGAAGVYTLEILHYGAGPTTYTVTGTIR